MKFVELFWAGVWVCDSKRQESREHRTTPFGGYPLKTTLVLSLTSIDSRLPTAMFNGHTRSATPFSRRFLGISTIDSSIITNGNISIDIMIYYSLLCYVVLRTCVVSDDSILYCALVHALAHGDNRNSCNDCKNCKNDN